MIVEKVSVYIQCLQYFIANISKVCVGGGEGRGERGEREGGIFKRAKWGFYYKTEFVNLLSFCIGTGCSPFYIAYL